MLLGSRNYIGNLNDSDLVNGFLSILHPQDWFDRAVAADGVHVAVSDDGAVVGFIVFTDPPSPAEAEPLPILRTMLDLTASVEFDGAPIAGQRYAFRGPVLVDRSARGHGLYAAFNTVVCEAYRDRYDLAVLFVSAANPRSVHTTTIKLGATPVATFEVHDQSYHLLAYSFWPPALHAAPRFFGNFFGQI